MIQKDHFNKIQKRIKQHKRSLLKKRLRPMAEKGRGYAISPLKVNFAKVYLLRLLTPLQGVQKSERLCRGLQGIALFLVFTKNSPRQKFSNRENFFQLAHFLPTKIFPFSTKKSRQKGLRPARPKACKVGQSILTDESADRDFSNRKKSLISRLLAFKPQKSVQLLNLTLWHFLHVRLFCFLYVFQKSYKFRYHFSYQ